MDLKRSPHLYKGWIFAFSQTVSQNIYKSFCESTYSHLYTGGWRRFYNRFSESFWENFWGILSLVYGKLNWFLQPDFWNSFEIILHHIGSGNANFMRERKNFFLHRKLILPHLYRGRWSGDINLVNQKFQIYLWVPLTILLHKIVEKRNTCAKFFEWCLHNIGSGKSIFTTAFRKYFVCFFLLV